MSLKQTEKDISYFANDLEKIRAKPQMYIGATDKVGIFTLLREILDNAVDEARAGRNDSIDIWLTEDAFWVSDKGTGIPVKKHPEANISTLTHILTSLQSSGKMKSGQAYKAAIGTHGVGLKADTALSAILKTWTFRQDAGGWYYTEFRKGVEKEKVRKGNAPKLPSGIKAKLGTVIMFVPDEQIFGNSINQWLGKDKKKIKANLSIIEKWCEMAAYMNSGLSISFTFRSDKTKNWKFKNGVQEYLENRLTKLKAEPINKKPISHSSENMDLILSFADVEGCEIEFFTNTIRNIEAGVHADDLYKALYDSLKLYKKKLEFTPTDIREGCVGLLNYKIDAPQFDSQTKEKLVDVRVKKACYQECLTVLEQYFSKNKSIAVQLVKRASEIRSLTNSFKASKKLVANVKKAGKKQSSKLAGIIGNAPIEERELLIVEGDSAGGTAKLARNKKHQAVLSLKGKPLNVMEATHDKINNNQEIVDIFSAIGFDLESEKSIQYGKIIFLVDPDVDGSHINCLLLTLFWRFAPQLFRAGKIYIIQSPEYLAVHKNKTYFGFSTQEVIKKAGTDKIKIDHLKGYGECSIEELQHIAINKDTRKLLKIMPTKDKASAKKFERLMGKNSEFRKEVLGVV